MAIKKVRAKPRLLTLGASLLSVGLVIELLSSKVLTLNLNVFHKTLLIMFMIAVGYGFAERAIAPLVAKLITTLKQPFKYLGNQKIGLTIFYLIIYTILYFAYVAVFTYGYRIPI